MTTTVEKQPEQTASRRDDDIEQVHPEKPVDSDDHQAEPQGVRKVEAFNKVLYQSGKSGKILLITLILSIGLTMFGYGEFSFDAGGQTATKAVLHRYPLPDRP